MTTPQSLREALIEVIGKAIRDSGYVTNPTMDEYIADKVIAILSAPPADSIEKAITELPEGWIYKLSGNGGGAKGGRTYCSITYVQGHWPPKQIDTWEFGPLSAFRAAMEQIPK